MGAVDVAQDWGHYTIPFLFPSYLNKFFTKSLKGQHVWIIGGTRGIGQSVAHLCHKHGAIVSISSRNLQNIISTRKTLSMQTSKGANVVYDISNGAHAAEEAYSDVASTAGKVDIVVINAGINQQALPFNQLSHQQITNLINTNCSGVIHTTRAVLNDALTEQRPHTLVTVSSLAAYRGVPGATVYGATKAAITTFSQALAIELRGKLNVVCVHPGFVNTPAISDLDHPKPFVMDEMQAARHVLFATVMKRSHYGFPWIMENIVLRFSTILPTPIYNFIIPFVNK